MSLILDVMLLKSDEGIQTVELPGHVQLLLCTT